MSSFLSHLDYRAKLHSGGFITYVLSLPSIAPIWQRHVNHPFVLGLGSGSLSIESFKTFLIQDYHFLKHYARIICMSAAQAPSLSDVFAQAEYVLSVREELKMHLSYCRDRFSLSESDIMRIAEHPVCLDYVSFVTHVGREDWLAMQVVLVPCMVGYKVVGEYLTSWNGTMKGPDNPYWSWIEQYAGKDYTDAIDKSTELLEKYASLQRPERIEELVKLFREAAEV